VPPDLAWAGPHYGSGRADPHASQLIYDRTRSVIRSADGSLSGALLQAIGQRCGLPGLDTFAVDGSILKWMAVVPSTRDYAESERRRLGVGRHTLGVHLRRGDKKVEAAYVSAARVNAEIARMHERWKFSSLFLASDSPHARREIRLPRGVALIFDDAEPRHDNANHKMLFRHPEMADDETRVAYKNIHLLSQCGGVIGQDNAHFATLAAASIALEVGDRSRILLIDGKAAESASRLRSAFARCRLLARSLAKRLVPWMTVSSRAERLRRQRRLG
jgi:hypothetical protein